MKLGPSSLGNTTNNWIGRSQFGDPLLDGSVDDFQIFNTALTQDQIRSLMQQNCSPRPCADSYREPASYTVQYLRNGAWVDVPGQVRSPVRPRANDNAVRFPGLTTPKIRVLMTPQAKSATANYGIGLKEIQIFNDH